MLKSTLNVITQCVLFSWLVLITLISLEIVGMQFIPARWWLKPWSVMVASGKYNQPWVTIDRRINTVHEVTRVAVLSDANNYNIQPCIGVVQTVEAGGERIVTRPLRQIIPFCNFAELAGPRHWRLTLYWTIHLDFGVQKTILQTSEPFQLLASERKP